MTDTTTRACERLFELMDNQPPDRGADNTEAHYERTLANIARRARAEEHVPPSPTEYVWDPAMMGDYWD